MVCWEDSVQMFKWQTTQYNHKEKRWVSADAFNSQQWVGTQCLWNVFREALQNQNLRFLLVVAVWAHLGYMCFSSSFPEGMQVFSINHRVWTNRLDTVNHLEAFWHCVLEVVGTLLQCEFPDVSQKSALKLACCFISSRTVSFPLTRLTGRTVFLFQSLSARGNGYRLLAF